MVINRTSTPLVSAKSLRYRSAISGQKPPGISVLPLCVPRVILPRVLSHAENRAVGRSPALFPAVRSIDTWSHSNSPAPAYMISNGVITDDYANKLLTNLLCSYRLQHSPRLAQHHIVQHGRAGEEKKKSLTFQRFFRTPIAPGENAMRS
jgi:hypothetical protein